MPRTQTPNPAYTLDGDNQTGDVPAGRRVGNVSRMPSVILTQNPPGGTATGLRRTIAGFVLVPDADDAPNIMTDALQLNADGTANAPNVTNITDDPTQHVG